MCCRLPCHKCECCCRRTADMALFHPLAQIALDNCPSHHIAFCRNSVTDPPPELNQLVNQQDKLDTAFWFCTWGTNLLMNGLIAFRIWKLTADMGVRRSKYMRIAYLILETGMFYSICLFLSAVINIVIFSNDDGDAGPGLAVDVIGAMLQELVGIFPTVIILLVALGWSVEQTSQYSEKAQNDHGEKLSTIEFASPPAHAQATGSTSGTQTIQLERKGDVFVPLSVRHIEIEEV
ncbi:hypothetical protein OE88DRAFT_128578 [Heliocybe sulcata]|uniref:Uncharacterized protein n=1 Tax=Heliocybe sulcata TaxID=5364 RepID=A0A5C3NJ26_9AGAM|nr:hypothetical protein OE88DRAFT_128578 [Heliocybe sulcata]